MATSSTFTLLDLDNMLDWQPGMQPNAQMSLQWLNPVLDRAEGLSGLSIKHGLAAMNTVTSRRIPNEIIKCLRARGIKTDKVEPIREEADKLLFFAAGNALDQGFDSFVVFSRDIGFSNVAGLIRNKKPNASLLVVVPRATNRLVEHYARFNGRIIELQAQVPRNEQAARRQDGYIVVCDTCGSRSLVSATSATRLCGFCGAFVRTKSAMGRIVPAGFIPFVDGPILEIWYKGELRRTAVLCTHSTLFGRRFDITSSSADVSLGDIVDEPERISKEQFKVTYQGLGSYGVRNVGTRHLYNHAGAEISDESFALLDGDEFWLNDRNSMSDADALLQFVFRQQKQQ